METRCPGCGGDGNYEICEGCGLVVDNCDCDSTAPEWHSRLVDCEECNGTGEVEEEEPDWNQEEE